jgi:hypothetical protein
MAERRMLAKSIIESDPFGNMPIEAQMLYVRLNLAADDDGFVSNPRSVMRMCGASEDSMKLLVAKKFVLTFNLGDDFIFLIKHWKIHNYIRTDRYRASTFKGLLREVYYDENKAYSLTPGDGKIPVMPPPEPYRRGDRTDTAGIPACLPDGTADGTSAGIPSDIPDGIPSDIPPVYQAGDRRSTQDRIGKSKREDSTEEEIIQDNSFSKLVEEGKSEGEERTAAAAGQQKELSPEARRARIQQLRNNLASYRRLGFPADTIYNLAAAEGITRAEIDGVPEERGS